MTEDFVASLLRDIDDVEADMRRLESRLTSVRERLHKAAIGIYSRVDLNGRPRPKQRPDREQDASADVQF